MAIVNVFGIYVFFLFRSANRCGWKSLEIKKKKCTCEYLKVLLNIAAHSSFQRGWWEDKYLKVFFSSFHRKKTCWGHQYIPISLPKSICSKIKENKNNFFKRSHIMKFLKYSYLLPKCIYIAQTCMIID